MRIGELKELISELPDEMQFGIMDRTCEDFYLGNYNVEKEDFSISDYVTEEDGEVAGKMLFLGFDNNMNEQPFVTDPL